MTNWRRGPKYSIGLAYDPYVGVNASSTPGFAPIFHASQTGPRLLAGIETVEEGRRRAALGVTLAQRFVIWRPAEPWPPINPELKRQIRPSICQKLIATAS